MTGKKYGRATGINDGEKHLVVLRRVARIEEAMASREGMRIDAIAAELGIDERTARRIIHSLEEWGVVTESRRVTKKTGAYHYAWFTDPKSPRVINRIR